jgi:DNA-binding NtrC family response regulator
VFAIHLPPLRERCEDIPLLMHYFLRKICSRHGRTLASFTTRLVSALLVHPFAGNIRELQNLIERGVIAASEGEVMDVIHLSKSGMQNMLASVDLTLEGKLSAVPLSVDQGARALEGSSLLQHAFDAQQALGEGPSCDTILTSLPGFILGGDRELGTSLEEIECLLVKLALEKTQGNITAAAQILGMSQ